MEVKRFFSLLSKSSHLSCISQERTALKKLLCDLKGEEFKEPNDYINKPARHSQPEYQGEFHLSVVNY